MLQAGPKEDPLDFRAKGGDKQDIAAKRGQQPGQQQNGNTAPQQKQADQNVKPSQEAAKVKDKLQAGQALNKNSTAKGVEASKQTNAAGARQASDAKAQIAQLKQNIKQDQQPQQDARPSPGGVAAGAAVSNSTFATGGAMLGVDMGLIAAGGAMVDAWRFMNSIGQASATASGPTNQPAPRSSLADMPGIHTPDDNADDDTGAELKALEAQEAELAGIQDHYTENTEHHEWREDHCVDYHEIEAPAGTNVQDLNVLAEKPDQFDIDYVGMNLRDVQMRYNHDSQPQSAVNDIHAAAHAHGGNALQARKPASETHDLPPPEMAKLGRYADQVMSFG